MIPISQVRADLYSRGEYQFTLGLPLPWWDDGISELEKVISQVIVRGLAAIQPQLDAEEIVLTLEPQENVQNPL